MQCRTTAKFEPEVISVRREERDLWNSNKVSLKTLARKLWLRRSIQKYWRAMNRGFVMRRRRLVSVEWSTQNSTHIWSTSFPLVQTHLPLVIAPVTSSRPRPRRLQDKYDYFACSIWSSINCPPLRSRRRKTSNLKYLRGIQIASNATMLPGRRS